MNWSYDWNQSNYLAQNSAYSKELKKQKKFYDSTENGCL